MALKKRVGLKEIAQEVGVSIALVSYVLNNQKENRIGKEVADKIRQVAKDLNYQPNQIAKSLKMQKTFTIGLIVADISNPFSSLIARIIEDEAKKKGYTVIFGSSDENLEKATDLINALLNRQVDGFIIAAVDNSVELLENLDKMGVPFVLIDRYFPDKNFNYIAIDNYKAAFGATSHLIANGRKKIGMITYDTTLFHLQERKRGYREALIQHNANANPAFLYEIGLSNIQQEVTNGIHHLLNLEKPVDALFFASNTLGLNGLKCLKGLTINIPKDLAIVAFDETEAYELFATPITHIAQPMYEIAKQATLTLLQKIDNPTHKVIQLILNTNLVIQASSK
jgi:LacI family transcriptional regulator